MAETRLILPATAIYGDEIGIFDLNDFPTVPTQRSGRASLIFYSGSSETSAVSVHFSMTTNYVAPNGLIVRLYYWGDSAPGGNNQVDWEVAWEAVSEGDVHDLDGGGNYFAPPQGDFDAMVADAGALNVFDIPFTNAEADSVVAGDTVRLAIRRDSDDANDTYGDSVYLASVEILEDV